MTQPKSKRLQTVGKIYQLSKSRQTVQYTRSVGFYIYEPAIQSSAAAAAAVFLVSRDI